MDKFEKKSTSNICSNRVLVDYRTDKESIEELKKLGVAVYKTTPLNVLYNEVIGHPDMQIHFTNKKAFCADGTYDYYKSLNFSNIELICGSKKLTAAYPNDVAYNVCAVGKYLVARPLSTASEILSEYRNLKKEILSVKQGYTKCSICKVNDDSVITADGGIYKVLHNKGINVLKIRPGYIDLYNMIGFIGGASGLINDKTLCFNGNIKTHPDSENIIAFCKNVGVDVISLNKGSLTDIGSILSF